MAGPVLSAGAAERSVKGYENLVELGRGGMGVAHLARSTGAGGFERFVVIKRLHRHLMEEKEALERFLHEARLAAYVNHANVVGVQHADVDDAGPYIVLDYVEGPSVDELSDRALLRGASIPIPILLRIALDALSGLDAIHRARRPDGEPLSILHRDVSPHNILVGRDGVSRVADFGVAKSALRTVSTDKGYVVGKILYLAPEYLRQQPIGPALDVYGLGISLWITLAGAEPWPEADDAQLLATVLQEGFPPIESASSAPPQVAAIINRACAIDVANRYASAREMAEAIEQLGRETSWVASHSEVADFVERHCGADLERRRRVVAETEGSVRSPPRTAEPPDSGTAPIPLGAARQHTGTMAVPAEPHPRSRRLAAGLGALGLVVAIGAVAAVWMTDEPEADDTPGAESATAVPPETATATSADPPAAEEAEPPQPIDSLPITVDEAPSPSRRAPPPKRPPKSAPAPRATPAPAATTTAAPPLETNEVQPPETATAPTAETAAPAIAPPPRPPSEITKKNPYR